MALDPAEPDALYNFSLTLALTGRLKVAVGVGQKLRTLEPFVPSTTFVTARDMLMSGQIQAAIAILQSIPVDAAGGYARNILLAQAYAADGHYADATDTLLAIPQRNVVSRQSVEDAARLLRTVLTKVKRRKNLPFWRAT